MPLNVLQLSQVKKRVTSHALECFLGGMIGAFGALLILALVT